MADLSIGTVQPLEGAQLMVGTSGEILVDGDYVYQKTSDSKYYKADNDDSAETASVSGMVVFGGAAADSPVCIQFGGAVDLGVTLTPGPYMLSSNVGKICPPADLGTGDYQSQTGYAVSAAQFNIYPIPTGIAKV